MKIFTLYTPSHRSLFEEYFVTSLLMMREPRFVLESRYCPQECPAAEYNTAGWEQTTLRKTEVFLEAVGEGETFVYADCDVQFFDNCYDHLLAALGDFDIAFQSDGPHGFCSGFFISKVNARTRCLFEQTRLLHPAFGRDQKAINSAIHLANAVALPGDAYFTIGSTNNWTNWNCEPVAAPDGILAHHANFTLGVSNKRRLMDAVKESVMGKRV
jgi:hypothetical protein